jgi:hypothetical protein
MFVVEKQRDEASCKESTLLAYLHYLLHDLDDGCRIFLRYVGKLPLLYTPSLPRI